jgi:hypothetical protein
MFEAFRTAIMHLLDGLRPSGEIVSPPPIHPTFKPSISEEPAQHGLETARALIFQLQTAGAPDALSKIPIEERPGEWNVYTVRRPRLSVEKFTDALLQQQYGLANAWRDLTADEDGHK